MPPVLAVKSLNLWNAKEVPRMSPFLWNLCIPLCGVILRDCMIFFLSRISFMVISSTDVSYPNTHF